MDTVFSKNMGVMQELQSSFDPLADRDTTTTHSLSKIASETTAFTKKALDQLTAESTTMISKVG